MSTEKRQKQHVKTSGSFVNWIMANNNSEPIVGKGATELCWSDRHAYEVLSVSEDGMSCIIDQYDAKRIDKNGMSESQEYEYKKLHGNPIKLVWRKKMGGCWCKATKELRIIPKAEKFMDTKSKHWGDYQRVIDVFGQDVHDKVWKYDKNGDRILDPVEGITKVYTRYDKMRIAFGYKQEYYDFTF